MFLDTLKERYDELGQTTKVIMAVITVLIVFMVATFVGIDTMLGKSEAQVRLYSTDATTAADVAKAVVADARREAVSQQDELRKAIDRVNELQQKQIEYSTRAQQAADVAKLSATAASEADARAQKAAIAADQSARVSSAAEQNILAMQAKYASNAAEVARQVASAAASAADATKALEQYKQLELVQTKKLLDAVQQTAGSAADALKYANQALEHSQLAESYAKKTTDTYTLLKALIASTNTTVASPTAVDAANTGSKTPTYEYVGCYLDKLDRALPTMYGTGSADYCLDQAVKAKQPYFGMQYWQGKNDMNTGECWVGGTTYSKHGPSTNCVTGSSGRPVGGAGANAVYKVNY